MSEMSDQKERLNPSKIVLLEPKISRAEASKVCKGLGKSHWIRSEANGFSGGIWLL